MADLKLKILGVEYDVPTSYTIGEARTIKNLTGYTLREFRNQMATDATDGNCTAALCLIAVQRVRPVTLEEIEAVPLDQVEFVGGDDVVPPDEAADDAAETSSTSSAERPSESAA